MRTATAATTPPATDGGGQGRGTELPHLRVVPGRPPAAVLWRRRIVAILALIAVAFLLTVAIGRVGAQAGLADQVAGHVVVQPGESLWDVAVATAPDGVDPRAQLGALEQLNGLRAADVQAWSVLLLPAR